MSLRARLLVGLVALVAAGLVTVGVVTYTEQRSFLLARIDQEASMATETVSHDLDCRGVNVPAATNTPIGRGPGPGAPPFDRGGPGDFGRGCGGSPPSLPPSTYTERRDAAGHRVGFHTYGGPTLAAAPELPKSIPVSDPGHSRSITVDSTGSSGLRYRVLAAATHDQPGTTVVAVPLREVDQTLGSLVEIELLVGGGVLLALIALAWSMIRIGLRPLDRMGATADAIAAGDLSRRVDPTTPRTEVGRLGLALNAMLQQIETAFAEREASAERLRRFLADASHELRTPLASIRGYAELLRIGAASSPEDTEKATSRIESEAARMGILVEDLLTLARLDEMPEPQWEPVDLSELARDAVSDTLAIAADRSMSLEANAPVPVLGDAHQLRQVITNLMRNAVVHTPAGTPIEVAVSRDGGEARIEVRDHGPGLPSGAADAVFERFWRADPGRGRGKAGGGLGLSIVASIVEAHGGRATAANAAGGGALFVVRLPALGAGRGPDPAPAPADAGARAAGDPAPAPVPAPAPAPAPGPGPARAPGPGPGPVGQAGGD
jgi:two-component system OmpR family sensor kinase